MGDDSDIVNQFKLGLRVSSLTNAPKAYAYLGGELPRIVPDTTIALPSLTLVAGESVSVIANAACAKSQSIFGIRRSSEESNVLWGRATAYRVLAWWSVANGFVHRKVTYTVGKEFGYLRPGDVVSLFDDELGEVDRVALVAGVDRGDAEWMDLTLQIVTNPATSRRTTGPYPDGGDLPPSN